MRQYKKKIIDKCQQAIRSCNECFTKFESLRPDCNNCMSKSRTDFAKEILDLIDM